MDPAPTTLPLHWHRWPLIDPYLDRRELGVNAGPVWWTERSSRQSFTGVQFALVDEISTQRGPFQFAAQNDTVLRILDRTTFMFGYGQYTGSGMLRLGPLELGVGAGLTLFSIDYSDGEFSGGLLSPRAAASVSFKVGTVRVGVSAFEEYYWRWLGRGSAITQGFLVEVRVEQPAVRTRAGHPLIFD